MTSCISRSAVVFLFLIFSFYSREVGAQSISPPAQTVPGTSQEELWARLKSLPPSLSWEAAGSLLLEAPGERYRPGFRLLARDHRTLRLEISDPFGRPVYYLVFYEGRIKALSLSDNKIVPLNLPALLKAFPLPAGTGWDDVFRLFWGRIPLPPGEAGSVRLLSERDPKRMRLGINGDRPQVIRLETEPFRLLGTEFPARGVSEAIQIFFSDFIELGGSYWPKKIEAGGLDSEKKVTIQYEQIIPRSDIPDEAFLIAEPK